MTNSIASTCYTCSTCSLLMATTHTYIKCCSCHRRHLTLATVWVAVVTHVMWVCLRKHKRDPVEMSGCNLRSTISAFDANDAKPSTRSAQVQFAWRTPCRRGDSALSNMREAARGILSILGVLHNQGTPALHHTGVRYLARYLATHRQTT